MPLNTNPLAYYSLRAPVYDEIYLRNDPGRQDELSDISKDIANYFSSEMNILEIACGTGYWTQILSTQVNSIIALDGSFDSLQLARKKDYPFDNVTFVLADAFNLRFIKGKFDGIIFNFWISHIPRNRMEVFISEVHSLLKPGGIVYCADNNNLPEYGGELTTIAGEEDGYKKRVLTDGSEHLIVKNYYNEDQLKVVFKDYYKEYKFHSGKFFWRWWHRIRS